MIKINEFKHSGVKSVMECKYKVVKDVKDECVKIVLKNSTQANCICNYFPSLPIIRTFVCIKQHLQQCQ